MIITNCKLAEIEVYRQSLQLIFIFRYPYKCSLCTISNKCIGNPNLTCLNEDKNLHNKSIKLLKI